MTRTCNYCNRRYEARRRSSKYCCAKCRVYGNRKRKRRYVHFRSDTCEWATPQDFFDELDREFHFTLDVAATPENAKCEKFYTKADDGLKQPWTGACWANPPYGRSLAKWFQKAAEAARSGATVVCLVPARTDTRWWHEHVAEAADVRFLKGRLKFGGAKNAAPFPSAVVVFKELRPAEESRSSTD
jgi:phage N-6-adenine-methyltransferase